MKEGFSIEIRQHFETLMQDVEWRRRTFEQLSKDMRMAGLNLEEASIIKHQDPIKFIASIIREVKGNKPLWDNLNYRIDLPSALALDNMEVNELTHLYLLRSFQKVWLRKQFGSLASKDDRDSTQNT
jgi:hypothetical protein